MAWVNLQASLAKSAKRLSLAKVTLPCGEFPRLPVLNGLAGSCSSTRKMYGFGSFSGPILATPVSRTDGRVMSGDVLRGFDRRGWGAAEAMYSRDMELSNPINMQMGA
jgi:hypothetical protein